MRFQITVDDIMGNEIQEKAHDLGFSVSSYVRFLLKSSLKTAKPSKLDSAILEESELISLKDFKNQLNELK